MIGRRAFLATAALAALTAPRFGEALSSTSPRVPRVGVLGEVNPIPWMARTPVVDIECRWAEAEGASLGDLASRLLAHDVDVVVAIGTASARAVIQHTTRVPTVAVVDGGLEEDAANASLARSVDNITWLSVPSEAGMARQRLAMLGRLVPHLRRVAVLFDPDTAASAHAVARLHGGAPAPVDDIRSFPVRSVDDVERVLARLTRDDVDGVVVMADTLFTGHTVRLTELTRAANLPTAYGARGFVEAGGLLAVHGDTGDIIRRTVMVVRRILGGESPATVLPSRQAPHVAINVSAAERLGLRVPSTVLARADTLVTR